MDTSGILLGEINLDSKLKNGNFILNYSNGSPKGIGQIKKGKPDGIWIAYYEKGNIMAKGKAKRGYKTGIWYYYNTDGLVDKVMIYNKKDRAKVENVTKQLKEFLNGS
jgi:antitoxin component YwqK of YwqJK toxin-antitoxin module